MLRKRRFQAPDGTSPRRDEALPGLIDVPALYGATMHSSREASIAAHQANIRRYRWMLSTQMTDLEQQFVNRRISEECDAIVQAGGTLDFNDRCEDRKSR